MTSIATGYRFPLILSKQYRECKQIMLSKFRVQQWLQSRRLHAGEFRVVADADAYLLTNNEVYKLEQEVRRYSSQNKHR